MNNNNVIVNPIITEKAMKASEKGRYTFLVDKSASKTNIKFAVSGLFKVNVVSVRTSILKGRKKRAGARRIDTIQPFLKKAVVRLKKGEKIGMFEPGGSQPEEQVKLIESAEKKENKKKPKKA